jgi:hypothetical protein
MKRTITTFAVLAATLVGAAPAVAVQNPQLQSARSSWSGVNTNQS